jgi:NAD(P)-dependent dehydrogenase (short-subunit alcohol dehydrogenase family)
VRPVALVTGGNRGIGRAIVLALAARGFDVTFADVADNDDTATTRRTAEALGARLAFVAADIADRASHERIVDSACALSGRIDVLVNNAGVTVLRRGDVLDVTAESFDRVMGINLRGTFFLTQAVARRMLADGPPTLGTTTPGSTEPRANAPPRSVITITSANATLAAPDRAEYCFSKTALSMMVKIFAVRLGAAGIACYEVRPGVIRTDMTAVAAQKYDRLIGDGLTPIARWGEAGDVGRVVATLAAGDLPFVTGDAVHVDGGLHIHKL